MNDMPLRGAHAVEVGLLSLNFSYCSIASTYGINEMQSKRERGGINHARHSARGTFGRRTRIEQEILTRIPCRFQNASGQISIAICKARWRVSGTPTGTSERQIRFGNGVVCAWGRCQADFACDRFLIAHDKIARVVYYQPIL
jgi:hypothetical protein